MDVLLTPVFIFTVLPIIPFFLVYLISIFLKKEKRASLLLAMDVTTFFLILSVSILFNNVFHSQFGFYLILLILLIVVGLIGGAQNRLKGKVDVGRMLRAVWRLTFAGAGIVYIILFLISFFTYISAI
ncbi:DUF3397 domain-containing protein [Paenibacillus sp. 79R4]|uniref:DUF3397 domain-containing protein n=1 Tax=Paenibacillus sp. 79R4 TaxID=2212847 RepID=UPI0015BE9872|nr:DUF3397 domain-containing protein [Paenibacillus sp. 79R4]NWL86827.1 DUF3397 domain-containing protein [Paenibacillus sp. 79R4]